MSVQRVEVQPQSWGVRYWFYCEGCKGGHGFDCRADGKGPSWTFDGNLERPTFSPSLLIRSGPVAGRSFPILGKKIDDLLSVPWEMLAPHDPQALKNHDGQNLERLAQRGGLSYEEALSVIEDREFRVTTPAGAARVLARKIGEWMETRTNHVCHSFVRDGRIEFLSDCTHDLAGKIVELPPID